MDEIKEFVVSVENSLNERICGALSACDEMCRESHLRQILGRDASAKEVLQEKLPGCVLDVLDALLKVLDSARSTLAKKKEQRRT